MSTQHHIPKFPYEIQEGVGLHRIAQSEIARLREELEHERYNVEKTAQEGAKRLRLVKEALAWMEERGRNSTSFGHHCHAYEVAAGHLKLALDGDDVSPLPSTVLDSGDQRS